MAAALTSYNFPDLEEKLVSWEKNGVPSTIVYGNFTVSARSGENEFFWRPWSNAWLFGRGYNSY